MILAINRVLHEEREYGAAVRRIDDIERRYLRAAELEERLELQRLAARRAFEAATDMGASFEEVSTRFRRLCWLGFHSTSAEMGKLIQFAYACVEYGHREEGLRLLARAHERLPESRLNPQSRVPALLKRCRQLLESEGVSGPSGPTGLAFQPTERLSGKK
jgi:hypothetical protein